MREALRSGVIAALAAWPLACQVNVTTANYGNDRTNANLQEAVLTTANVAPGGFGKIGTLPVDGQIYAQPLYASGVNVQGKTRNVVYVATMHNSVYAFDADAPSHPAPLWRVNLGPPVSSSFLGFEDVTPEVGILSTPAIDLARGALYAVSDTFENGTAVFRLHALDLADGREKLGGPATIAAQAQGDGAGNEGGVIAFDAAQHLQRPGLLLANGAVYAAFGSHADQDPAHGWVIAYDASNLARRKAVFNTTANGSLGSIWQSGRGLAADAAGNVYFATGNGDYDGVTNFGESFVKLSGALAVLDWFTPLNWAELSDADNDLGSLGPALIPGTKLLLGGDKAGTAYLLDRDQMGHLGGAASSQVLPGINIAGIFNAAVWADGPGRAVVYIQEQGESLKSYRLTNGIFETAPFSVSPNPTGELPYEGLTISANGSAAGTGVVWESMGDQAQAGVPGTLYAFDATNLGQELWDSEMNPARDRLGAFAKFANPTVANGRVYVPTFSNQLAVYGLLSNQSGDEAPQVGAVVNGASYLERSLSPGEVVAVFGSGLGPADLAIGQVDASGRYTTELASTRIWFDGIPAPLLYTSAGQAGAIVPYGISGSSTLVQAEYLGQVSGADPIAAESAAPALFSLDNSGTGQGAILNEDGSLNGRDRPAARGSVMVLYATGLGRTDPAGDDGKVTDATGTALPKPVLRVAVQIGGEDAEVLYAGAAPGIVSGVFQINARVPASTPPGEAVPVAVQSGDQSSQPGITCAVK